MKKYPCFIIFCFVIRINLRLHAHKFDVFHVIILMIILRACQARACKIRKMPG